MKTSKHLLTIAALIAALAAPSLFADSRHESRTDDWRMRQSQSRRTTVEGRIRDIDRDRNGFVIRLDRGRLDLFVPVDARVENASSRNSRSHRARPRDLERGDQIRATGVIDARGIVYVDTVVLLREEDDRRDRNDALVSGIVQNVDRRAEVVWIQDGRSRSNIAVDTRNLNDRHDEDNLRRGDHVTFRGDWRKDGKFEAESMRVNRDERR